VAHAFADKLRFNHSMLEAIVASINKQINSKLSSAPAYTVEAVLAILSDGQSQASPSFLSDDDDTTISLSFDYLTFLMGECCNE